MCAHTNAHMCMCTDTRMRTHTNTHTQRVHIRTQIAEEVDSDPRSAYFRQARNGLYIRMAILKLAILGA